MDITPLISADRQVIQAYGDGGFRISGRGHTGSVLIFPGRTEVWPVASLAEVTLANLEAVSREQPAIEILLIGTGSRMQLLPASVRRQLREAGIVADLMDTGAACRTYNVLMMEDRRVAAALIAI
ncbi:MAG: Mth938-like domain-containing protein [Rhodospirillales bacterium]|nr:Mth938-like domain-containing protein [Rhodospirillales bacterium]